MGTPTEWFHFEREDIWPLFLVVCCQLLFGLGLLAFALYVDLAYGIALLLLLAVPIVVLDRWIYHFIRQQAIIAHTEPWLRRWIIWTAISFLVVLVAFVRWIAGRTQWDAPASAVAGAGAIVLTIVMASLVWRIGLRPLRRRRAPWIILGMGLCVLPILGSGWVLISPDRPESATVLLPDSGTNRWKNGSSQRAAALARRADLTRCHDGERWRVGNNDIEVAVALSGGGYRAAVTHAGLLAALDAQCVPIKILTTVSGGSIVGAFYALGYPAEDFARLLWQRHPGLPIEKFNLPGFAHLMFSGSKSDADAYADHFARVYFGAATLADLPDRPVLAVNATDLETVPRQAREVFFRERAAMLTLPDGATLDHKLRVADVVAASGAFPGAFEPKTLFWAPSVSAIFNPPPVERRFIDGGVLENLGLDGLHRYLVLRRQDGTLPQRPHLLIVSDASKQAGKVERGFDRLGLIVRAEEIGAERSQASLYAQYTGHYDFADWLGRDEPLGEQVSHVAYGQIDSAFASGQPAELEVVVIPLTASELSAQLEKLSGCQFGSEPIAAVQREVASFDTLKELDRQQVEKAFWLGYTLGTLYGDGIRLAREHARAAAQGGDSMSPPSQGTTADVSAVRQSACTGSDEVVKLVREKP